MLSLVNLSAGYGQSEVLKDISVDFQEGEVTAILGPNGSGKTTLLKVLAGILKPKRGLVELDGRNLAAMNPKELAKKIAYLPQISEIAGQTTVFEAVLLGRKPYLVFEASEKDLATAEAVIKLLGLEELAFRLVGELSGGEKQKVMLARALAQEPRVLLLDEPINHLDPKSQRELLTLLRELAEAQNLICLLVFHELNQALRYSGRFLLMKAGRICYQGNRSIINRQSLREVFEVNLEVIEYQGQMLVI